MLKDSHQQLSEPSLAKVVTMLREMRCTYASHAKQYVGFISEEFCEYCMIAATRSNLDRRHEASKHWGEQGVCE